MTNLAISNMGVIAIGLFAISCIMCVAKIVVIAKYGSSAWRRSK